MCGIAGKINFDASRQVEQREIRPMLDIMHHRGPDGSGIHIDGPVGLGHVRLSIIDIEAGKQPLSNEDDTVWVTFNGEIYNFQELRGKLIAKGHRFKTHSDTEVIVHLYEEYGKACVDHLQGMFAFSIWDSRKSKLFIARDRVGIKPLYYFKDSNLLCFASELKALRTLPGSPCEINHEAVDAFWCFNYLPGELTMFRGIHKLLPGHWLEVDLAGNLKTQQYWDLVINPDDRFSSIDEASEELSGLLRKTIGMHMMSDVPVGFLLSGGMDSSAVLSYAADETDKEISAFTVGFSEEGIVDERPFAKLVAQRYGAKHYDITVTANDFWEYLPKLMWHLDEPVCEPPAVALHYISKLASEHVKVLLSGECGDEAFGGYPNYPNQLKLQKLREIVGPVKGFAASAALGAGKILGKTKIERYGRMLGLKPEDYYWSRVGSPFRESDSTCPIRYRNDFMDRVSKDGQKSFMKSLYSNVKGETLLNQLLYIDTKTWLPDDLLLKADKTTMANSIELRVPLLDHEILEFAASLPPDYKVYRNEIKRVLKQTFSSILPREIIDRKKVGFPVPYGKWMATSLRDKVQETLLDPESFVSKYFEPKTIGLILDEHNLTRNSQRSVFSLLALEFWSKSN